jgi:serine/threonine protein kinase
MNGYEIVNFIGEGRFSSIFKVRKLADHFVLKKLRFESDEAHLKKVYEQFSKISQINHPNILKYHEIAFDAKSKNIW